MQQCEKHKEFVNDDCCKLDNVVLHPLDGFFFNFESWVLSYIHFANSFDLFCGVNFLYNVKE
jgi:hypothetical protein